MYLCVFFTDGYMSGLMYILDILTFVCDDGLILMASSDFKHVFRLKTKRSKLEIVLLFLFLAPALFFLSSSSITEMFLFLGSGPTCCVLSVYLPLNFRKLVQAC